MNKKTVSEKEFEVYINQMQEMYSNLEIFKKSKDELYKLYWLFNLLGENWSDEQLEILQQIKKDTQNLVDEVVHFLKN